VTPFFRRKKPNEQPEDPRPEEVPEESPPAIDPGSTIQHVRRAQEPDDTPEWQASWAQLSDKIYHFLHRRFARNRLPPYLDFEDLYSGVLARMLQDLPGLKFEHREAFWAWVRKATANELVSIWRRHGAQKRGGGKVIQQQTDEEDLDVLQSVDDPEAQPASVYMRVTELEDAEIDCLSQVPNKDSQQVYLLRRKDGFSFEEIAEKLGHGNAESMRVLFHRTKQKVRSCLRGKLDGYTEFIRT